MSRLSLNTYNNLTIHSSRPNVEGSRNEQAPDRLAKRFVNRIKDSVLDDWRASLKTGTNVKLVDIVWVNGQQQSHNTITYSFEALRSPLEQAEFTATVRQRGHRASPLRIRTLKSDLSRHPRTQPTAHQIEWSPVALQ